MTINCDECQKNKSTHECKLCGCEYCEDCAENINFCCDCQGQTIFKKDVEVAQNEKESGE